MGSLYKKTQRVSSYMTGISLDEVCSDAMHGKFQNAISFKKSMEARRKRNYQGCTRPGIPRQRTEERGRQIVKKRPFAWIVYAGALFFFVIEAKKVMLDSKQCGEHQRSERMNDKDRYGIAHVSMHAKKSNSKEISPLRMDAAAYKQDVLAL